MYSPIKQCSLAERKVMECDCLKPSPQEVVQAGPVWISLGTGRNNAATPTSTSVLALCPLARCRMFAHPLLMAASQPRDARELRRADALHEDEGPQALGISQALRELLPVQVVAPALPLGLEHKAAMVPASLCHDGLRVRVPHIVQTPQACPIGRVAEVGLSAAADQGQMRASIPGVCVRDKAAGAWQACCMVYRA